MADIAASGREPRRPFAGVGLVAGPMLALLLYALLPTSYAAADGAEVAFSHAGRATLALMAWMAVWWVTEALDVQATALLPLVVLPLAGAASMARAAAPYANEFIFLFMGGFVLALGMQRHRLDQRIALLTLRIVGASPRRMVLGFMIATAAISGFVSNTATAAMMLPVGLGVVALVSRDAAAAEERERKNFALSLMLGIAYAASIGGVATLVGTPPNVFLAGYLRDSIDPAYRTELGFARWLAIGVPLAVVFLPLAWWLLVDVLYPVRLPPLHGAREHLREAYRALGPTSRGEWTVFLVFCATALAWLARPVLARGWTRGGEVLVPALAPGLTDAGIAMLAAMALFVVPVGGGRRAMDWETARGLPWGVLLLFGGGLSLAAAIESNGVAEFLGARAAGCGHLPPVVLVVGVSALVVFFSEIASNTATAAAFVPILAALAPALGVHPFVLVVPATLAASYAFMLPVGTPPNAIVFATGHVTMAQMMRAGVWLNLIAVALITAVAFALVGPVLVPR